MARLKVRLRQADRAPATLEELLDQAGTDALVRDAAIQRFETSFEAVWKAAQRYLRVVEGIEEGSPKAVIRACVRTGVLSAGDGRAALAMVGDQVRHGAVIRG